MKSAFTLNRTVLLAAFVLLLSGCQEQEAYAMCYAAGYPNLKMSIDMGKRKFYCHRLVNATDEMKEVHP